jgi:hypothetical protein
MIKKLMRLLKSEGDQYGFMYQEVYGDCGEYAILHAALVLGIPISSETVHRATGVSKKHSAIYGTSAGAIRRALNKFDLESVVCDIKDEEEAKKAIDRALETGYPIIASVENEEHWIVLVSKDSHGYYWIDSSDYQLLGCSGFREISEWLEYEEEDKTGYYFIVVKPKDENIMKHSISGCFNNILKLYEKDEDLIYYWGWYLAGLKEALDCPKDKKEVISAKAFFEKHRSTLEEACKIIDDSESDLEYELSNFSIVAQMHNLTMSKELELEGMLKMNHLLNNLAWDPV